MRHVLKIAATAMVLAVPVSARAQDPRLSANAPVLRYDSAETDRATAVEALTTPPTGDRIALKARRHPLPDVVYGRVARGPGAAGRGCSTGFCTPATRRTGGSCGPGATRATGKSSRSGSTPANARRCGVRPSTTGPRPAPTARSSAAAGPRWSRRQRLARLLPARRRARAAVARPRRPGRRAGERGAAGVRDRWAAPARVRWPGSWGRTEARPSPGREMDSPKGPAFQGKGPWRDPDAYLARAR